MRFAISACILVALLLKPVFGHAAETEDILIADFEAAEYGEWMVEGEAFGPGPAAGTLPDQMHVSGYEGQRLVNSYFKGDGTTGRLTSPPVRIERKYINFLIGGGAHPDETCINLLHEGEIVRTATGPNDRPGGSERLDWHSWDVGDLAGETVRIEIVDRYTGGWGHINVDQIVQSDKKLQAEPARRELAIERRYLHLPVRTGAPMRRMKFVVDGTTVREFDIEYAETQPEFFVFSDVEAFRGRTMTLEVDRLPTGSPVLEGVVASDEPPAADSLYAERHRPQFHFTSRRGWLNDPNGMVYHDGEYHLYYQHNPYGWNWGNMHWGHAVSRDLVHWTELPIALYPRRYGDWCFSGSAVVDAENTSGFGTQDNPPLVAAYTSTGRGECIVYSNDRGRSWTEFEGNPVVRHAGRDPRLLWHEASRQWVMAVYTEEPGTQAIAFHTSPDLRTWTYQSRIDGFFECPDLFELPVEGSDGETRWVLYAADGKYMLGEFDGREFRPESGKHTLWHGNFYAAQTFSNTADGRRIQIGWGRGVEFPGMPFNQQMTVPVTLTLRSTADGPRMFAWPVAELASLREDVHALSDVVVEPGRARRWEVSRDLLDVAAEIEPGEAETVVLTVSGVSVTYDAKRSQLICGAVSAPLVATEGRVRLRVLADRGSLEIFGSDGAIALSVAAIAPEGQGGVEVSATGGTARLPSLQVHELSSAWDPR